MTRWPVLLVAAVLTLGVGGPALAQEQDEVNEVNIEGALPGAGDIIGDVQTAFGDPAVEEVTFRDFSVTQQEAETLFLDPESGNNLLLNQNLRNAIPEGGQVRFRGSINGERFRARVQREEGTLRVRVEGARFADADAARAFAAGLQGFDRVRVEGFDANGNRVRIERRNGMVRRDEVRPDHRGRGKAEDRRHRGRDKASRDLNDDHAKDFGRDDHNRHRGRHREAIREHRDRDGDRVEKLERHHRSRRREHVERRERHERGHRSGRH